MSTVAHATVPLATAQSDTSLPLDEFIAEIAARRDEFVRVSHVPRDMIAKLKRAGIYRAATPQRFARRRASARRVPGDDRTHCDGERLRCVGR